jgi:hypothetical protein
VLVPLRPASFRTLDRVVGSGRLGLPLIAAVAAAALGGCGGSGGSGSSAPATPASVPAPPRFPATAGRTLGELRAGLGPGPRLATSVSVLEPGHNRMAFAMFDRARRQIADTPMALYVASPDGSQVRGPFRARYVSLTVGPRFVSRTTSRDPDSAHSIYVASPEFPKPGRYRVLGVAQLDQRFVGAAPVTVTVRSSWRPPPDVGDPAPRVHTPTRESVHGDLAAIDTRVPPDTMHEIDLADVLGRRPVMLLFATPGLCPSRICGPVTDVLEQLKSESTGDAAFIHMEIYNGNRPAAGQRPQVRAYGLPSEPWLFAIDRSGRVAARVEGAFSMDEARAALHDALTGARASRH